MHPQQPQDGPHYPEQQQPGYGPQYPPGYPQQQPPQYPPQYPQQPPAGHYPPPQQTVTTSGLPMWMHMCYLFLGWIPCFIGWVIWPIHWWFAKSKSRTTTTHYR